MIPGMHARDARFIPGGMAGKGRHRRRAGTVAAATRSRRLRVRCGAAEAAWSLEAAGKRWRAAGRRAGVRRSRHGWSCLLQGGTLHARVRGRAGQSAAVRGRARPNEQQCGPTWPILEAADQAWQKRSELGHGNRKKSGKERALAGTTRGGARDKTGPRPPTCCEQWHEAV